MYACQRPIAFKLKIQIKSQKYVSIRPDTSNFVFYAVINKKKMFTSPNAVYSSFYATWFSSVHLVIPTLKRKLALHCPSWKSTHWVIYILNVWSFNDGVPCLKGSSILVACRLDVTTCPHLFKHVLQHAPGCPLSRLVTCPSSPYLLTLKSYSL